MMVTFRQPTMLPSLRCGSAFPVDYISTIQQLPAMRVVDNYV